VSTGEISGFGEAAESAGMPRILVDLADGRLDSASVDAVVEWLRSSDDTEPPARLLNRAVRIPHQAEADQGGRPAMWRRLVAALVYDTRLQPGLAGARAATVEEPRLMYQAGGIEIDLEIGQSSIAGRLRMLGQVTSGEPNASGAWVLAEGPSGSTETEVDHLGQFVLDGLLAGRHRMEIDLRHQVIEIPEVHI
jgi:hypothetical protein